MVTLRLISDGTPMGSHVYVAETGDEVKNIRSVAIKVDAGKMPTMVLEVIKPKINAVGKLEAEVIDGNLVIQEVECDPLIDINNPRGESGL